MIARSTAVRLTLSLAAFAATLGVASREARATIVDAGPEIGVVKRSADAPYGMKAGLGWGAHAEVVLLPFLSIGPYYLHYELAPADGSSRSASNAFDALGGRARLSLPLPSLDLRPYAFVGAGYTWITYPAVSLPTDPSSPAARTGGFAERSGHFVEIPVGLGVAYDVARILALSADFALRPGTSFDGSAYDEASGTPVLPKPSMGWSFLLGASLRL